MGVPTSSYNRGLAIFHRPLLTRPSYMASTPFLSQYHDHQQCNRYTAPRLAETTAYDLHPSAQVEYSGPIALSWVQGQFWSVFGGFEYGAELSVFA